MKTTLSLGAICSLLIINSAFGSSIRLQESSGGKTLYFTENKGQWQNDVRFRCDAGGAIVWICKDRIIYQFLRKVHGAGVNKHSDESSNPGSFPLVNESDQVEQLLITARFIGSNPNVSMVGSGEMEYKCNYFLGADQSRWRTDVPSYQSATLENVYPGVDLSFFSGANGQLSYQFDAANDATAELVKIEYDGIVKVSTDQSGRFIAATTFGEIEGLIARPGVASTEASDQSHLHFDSFEANLRSPQAISLIFSTFLGGSDIDYSWDMTIDRNGNAYIAGMTYSSDFPHPNAYDSTFDGGFGDVVVSKLSANGNSLLYSTYLGGSHIEASQCIVVDSAGFAYVAGSTSSVDFPTQNAYDTSLSGQDAFLTKLSANGNVLVYSTLLGGSSYETPFGIAVDKFGSAFLTGESFSSDFPKVNAFDATLAGSRDVFVTKFSAAGNTLLYSTYLGGSDIEVPRCIVVDGLGAAYVTGQTNSFNYPTQNAYDASAGGFGEDAFVTKLSAAGNTLAYSTYLGGSSDDWGYGIAIDSSGNAYVTGGTYSNNFPRLGAYDSTQSGSSEDVFVTKFSSAGNTLVYSTYLGAAQRDRGTDIEVDGSGSAYVTGITNSVSFPTQDAFDSTANGDDDAFVTKFSPAGNTLAYSTFLGGVNLDTGIELEIDLSGNVYLCGNTWSPNFPKVNAIDTSLSGLQDGYIAKLSVEDNAVVGDCDQNGQIDITDAVYLVNYIFAGGPAPSLSVGDADCNLQIDITDAVYLINYIFASGPAPGAACP